MLAAEEERFAETLERGMKLLRGGGGGRARSRGDDAFTLQATYGFPIELTRELARERGLEVNEEEYTRLMEEHREISRAGVAGGERAARGRVRRRARASAPSSSATRRPRC